MKEEIYKIIDRFLVEAKDQNGKERSLEQLNQDRHLAAERFEELIKQSRQEIAEEIETKLIKQWKNNCSQTSEELLEELGKILNNL